MRRKVAVIGAGISGMGAAHALGADQQVTLFEAEGRLGGHARTRIAGKRGDQPVDTGFIVFNHVNYPELTALFRALDVPIVESRMSFGASVAGGRIEYGLDGARAFFAQRRNALNPSFLRMLRDIFRFNEGALTVARDPGLTIGGLIERMRLGKYFRDYYLLPFSGAIWSTPTEQILQYPAQAMLQFFKNHALLGYDGQHQWYTVQGGSIAYVERLSRAMTERGVEIRLGCPVQAVRRDENGVEIRAHGGTWERFDEVVFATHSDITLRLLSDASDQERADLGAVRYQPNDAVLHADTAIMPKRRAVWSSWNYAEGPSGREGPIDITYWMNSLQPIPMDDPLFVTLNSARPIREELIHDQVTLDHPVFDLAALAAQKRIAATNGADNTWFCGAWMRHGFHEDGLATALEVAHALQARARPAVAAQ